MQIPSLIVLNVTSNSDNPLSNNRAVGFDTPPRPVQHRYTPTGTCFRWGVSYIIFQLGNAHVNNFSAALTRI